MAAGMVADLREELFRHLVEDEEQLSLPVSFSFLQAQTETFRRDCL